MNKEQIIEIAKEFIPQKEERAECTVIVDDKFYDLFADKILALMPSEEQIHNEGEMRYMNPSKFIEGANFVKNFKRT